MPPKPWCLGYPVCRFNCQGKKSMPGKFLDIVGQEPSRAKSSRLHVDIYEFFLIYLRYIP